MNTTAASHPDSYSDELTQIKLKTPVNQKQVRQAERLRTHTLAELKKYKWLPFLYTYSAVLLDISLSGVKLAFSGEVSVKPQTIYLLKVPLIPLGITHLKSFECPIEVKWFDQQNYRLGGLFMNMNSNQSELLSQIIESVQSKNNSQ